MSRESFAAFLKRVSENPELQRDLNDADSKEAFTAAAVSLGAQHGFAFTAEDVHESMARFETGPDAELNETELSAMAGGLSLKPVATVFCRSSGTSGGGWTPPSTLVPSLCQDLPL